MLRPPGPVVCIHTPPDRPLSDLELAAIADLRQAVAKQNPKINITTVHRAGGTDDPSRVIYAGETARDAQRFLQTWRPSLGLWLEPGDPNLVRVHDEQGIPAVTLVPTRSEANDRLARASLPFYHHVLAADEDTASALSMPLGKSYEVVGPLLDCPAPLKANSAELEDLSGRLAGRPVWLAANPPLYEIPAIIAAHRQAMQRTHRLLLLLMINEDDPDDAWRASAGRMTERDVEGEPEDSSEVFLIRGQDELGLWLRLAPLTYLGGTLSQGCAINPMVAAALGSALISGYKGGPYSRELQRLDSVNALKRIGTAKGLGRMVINLMSMDSAALLAQNAWALSTEGAPLLNRLEQLILDAVERTPAGPAPAV
ncbi:MAG: hypothetical protein AAFQ66_04170 [Pseudomonadota bacterium]